MNAGRFKPGQSGNPEGARLHKPSALRAELLPHSPAVLKKLVSMAKAGDPNAMRMYLDRVLPALRPEAAAVQVQLADGTSTAQAKALMQLAAQGELAPDVASDLIRALGAVVAIEQGDELKKRLDALEGFEPAPARDTDPDTDEAYEWA